MKKSSLLLIPLAVLLLGYLAAPTYLRMAFTYYTPNIDDYTIFENREIKRGEPEPWIQHARYNSIALPDSLQEQVEDYDPVALLLIKNGAIVYEQYWDGYNEHSLSNSFSVAKSIISLLVGIAVQEGAINSLDDPIGNYLPQHRGSPATIRHLLMMSSGLDWDESYSTPFSITTQAYYGDDLRKLMQEPKIIHQPGQVWNYQSGNTQLLAMILEQATGQSVSDYTSARLWKPIGANRDALWSLDRQDGIEKAYCCFNSNARDFARLGQLVLDSGVWQGVQVVPKPYLQRALAPLSQLKGPDNEAVSYYGYHWWMVPYGQSYIPYARGILGQYVMAFPEERAVLVRLGHKRDAEQINYQPKDVYLYLEVARYLLERL
ncbi:serine hydrolase domain-containing protein [Cesiribacter andamanensis]|uniref:6-aminohexanoate-dimer hydrolase n=1 Tax=Cesiribacter andamanensis AMV16 TaxID=1279009 RepID=M7NIZ7_9BACT|nr:serine hydrolase [Cesiribacter andamanensis]EMR01730.1 6-aminohexanoate-dimer hydrolase [Cesiribacter andamanensis AMV16]